MKQTRLTLAKVAMVTLSIMLLAGFGGPLLLRSRIAANEGSAIAQLQSVVKAQESYRSLYPARGFASSLSELGGTQPCRPGKDPGCRLDKLLAAGNKSGYVYAILAPGHPSGPLGDYVVTAAPQNFGASGVRTFCATPDGVIRYDANRQRATSPPAAEECSRMLPLE